MKPRNEEQKLTEGQTKAKKPRFKIEKLEERIAPHAPRCEFDRRSGSIVCHHGRGPGDGPPGRDR